MPGSMISGTPVLSDRSIEVAQAAIVTRRFGTAVFGRYTSRHFYATSGRSDWPQFMRKVEFTHGTTLTKWHIFLPNRAATNRTARLGCGR